MEVAIQAYEDGLVRIFKGDDELECLDEMIEVYEEDKKIKDVSILEQIK